MRARLVLLSLCAAVAGSAQYTYDYSKNPVVADSTRWTTNGTATYSTATGVTYSGSSGGSLISQRAISVEAGGSANDYEVNTTLALNSGGGDYIHFLRTSSGSVVAGSGSYISVELLAPSTFNGSGSASATLNVNLCTNGAVTQLGSTTVTATNGMTLRSVIWSTNLWVFVNNLLVYTGTVPSGFSGNPGIGGYDMPGNSGILAVELGHHDTVAPNQVPVNPLPTSLFPTSVSLKWQGVLDDTNGVGQFAYYVSRNGVQMAMTPLAEFGDSTVQPGTTYTYLLQAVDYHGNVNAGTSVTVTTPAAGSVDPRRVGLYSTGSYWGGGGEQIDTLSGNLHFSVPLLTAQGRLGDKHPVNLVYDSQNWRNDNGTNWELGNDVGYGFGWKVLIGSITPYFAGYWSPVDHFVYTDGTGAQYLLNSNSNGVWTSSTQSVYVWLDTTVSPYKLHFADGSFWVMGSTSAGTEQDAGTMYPTIIEDRFGNQIIVTYDTGAGLPYVVNQYTQIYENNTSARILSIEDPRQVPGGCPSPVVEKLTYCFSYDHTHYVIPHLLWYTNDIHTSEFSGNFTYNSVTQEPPFGSDPNYGGPVELLTDIPLGANGPYQFTYDTAGAGELMGVVFPYGAEISWNYDTFEYIGGRSLREVSARYLAPDALHATNPQWGYGISRPDAPNSVTVHSAMTLTDASGIGAKTWSFNTSGSPWQIGLTSDYQQLSAANGAVLHDDQYTWSQDAAGRPYISADTSITDEGQSYQESALSTQRLDPYGNVTQSLLYPYNNTTSPQLTYNNTYITSSHYTSNYIFNLLLTSTVTPTGGSAITLATNQYDGYACASGPFGGSVCGTGVNSTNSPPSAEFDANSPIPVGYRGALVTTVTPTKAAAVGTYYAYGGAENVSGTDGTAATLSADSATNYAAPETINVQGYNQSVSYNSWLGITSTIGVNGEQLQMAYDQYGRPATGTSAYGAVTNYSYNTSTPFTQTESGPNGVTVTTLDGFGRAVLVQKGDSATPDATTSYVQTVYAPCACSPLGKVSQVSMPYPAGGSASAWTTYTYDGLGRAVTTVKPDGASTTHYAYSGNQTTVTDPAGKWKQYTKDVLGNLTTVIEPDPCVSTNTLTTNYTYNWMNKVTQVSMQRPTVSYSGTTCTEPGGSTTQTRTFVYDSGGRLTSATNPENGTVTYTYNSTNTLATKTDAKGQSTYYYYDSNNRVVGTAYCACPSGPYDVSYYYDTNPIESGFSQYSSGRLAAVKYSNQQGTITEEYSYHPAGGILDKRLTVPGYYLDAYGYFEGPYGAAMDLTYTYDYAGRVSSTTYPDYGEGPETFTYTYDAMGRPQSLADSWLAALYGYSIGWAPPNRAQNAQYDYAGRLTGVQYWTGPGYSGSTYLGPMYSEENWAYNVNGQMASISWKNLWTNSSEGAIQYGYASTQDNGQITQADDTISGETITYQYDALKRLISASSSPNSGGTPAAWTETFRYDGFGNLTAKVLNGTTTSIAVNAATNQLSNAYYDANGNMTSGAGATLGYDIANRLTSVLPVSGGVAEYSYSPGNKRIYAAIPDGYGYTANLYTLYGVGGEKIGDFRPVCNSSGSCHWLTYTTLPKIWFAGRLVTEGGGIAQQDRLGTNRTGGARYYPYGDEITSTANDHVKFGTYTRDAFSGLDYADQRFYASTYGRFLTPDPAGTEAAKLKDPVSWNRYAYTRGDPVNRRDVSGLDDTGGCVENPDGTIDCGVIGSATGTLGDDSGWSWGDPLGDDFWASMAGPDFNPSAAAECLPACGNPQQAQVAAAQAAVNWSTQFRVQAAGNIALNALLNNSECASLFGVYDFGAITNGVPDPYDVLSAILNGTGYASIAYGNMAPTSGNPATGNYTINNAITQPVLPYSGATFSSATITFNTSQYAPFNFANTSLVTNAATILHELGHVYEFLFGQSTTSILDDSTSAQTSAANQQLVMTRCFPGQ